MAEGWHELSFFTPPEHPEPAAGQFVSLALPHYVFRKPFAISNYNRKTRLCSMLYEVRGEGTRAMSIMQTGEIIDVMGFHGNAFTPPSKRAILVSGGIGLGPLLYFEKTLAEKNISATLYAGFREAALIPHALIKACRDVVVCTDDGSEGLRGTVLDALAYPQKNKTQETTLYLCGPLGMLKAGVAYARQNGIPAVVSLEAIMACATGACMGCVVPVRPHSNGRSGCYKRVCVEGPIFNAEDIRWQDMHKTR